MNAAAGVPGRVRQHRIVLATLVVAALASIAWMAVRDPEAVSAWFPRAGTEASIARGDAARAASPATASSPSTDASASREEAIAAAVLERYFRARLQHPDPRQRLVALRILTVATPDLATRRRARLEAARLHAEAPDDPVIALALEWFCGDAGDPCTAAERDAWPRVDHANAVAHFGALERAADSPAQQDALLARMAASERHDSRIHELALETIAAFDDYAPPPLGPAERRTLREAGHGEDLAARRQFMASQYVWAMPFPSALGVSRACRPPLAVARARDCRAVLLRMAGASTLIERKLAMSLLEQITRGTPESAHWARELQRLRWWSRQFADLITGPGYWQDFIRYGEIEAMRLGLLRAGRPLDPPPSWRPGAG